jgi:hypothetical protein
MSKKQRTTSNVIALHPGLQKVRGDLATYHQRQLDSVFYYAVVMKLGESAQEQLARAREKGDADDLDLVNHVIRSVGFRVQESVVAAKSFVLDEVVYYNPHLFDVERHTYALLLEVLVERMLTLKRFPVARHRARFLALGIARQLGFERQWRKRCKPLATLNVANDNDPAPLLRVVS